VHWHGDGDEVDLSEADGLGGFDGEVECVDVVAGFAECGGGDARPIGWWPIS